MPANQPGLAQPSREKPVQSQRIIVIGASSGGVETLTQLVRCLPAELPVAIFVVVHVPAHSPSALPKILSRAGQLPALHPQDRLAIQPGKIYVAPPDQHLLIKRGFMQLSQGPKENRYRPAIDPLFRTAARAYGPQVVGVVLSGALDDGTAGLMVVKQQGGFAIAQDPQEALYASMPRSAIANVAVDAVLPVVEIADLLIKLAAQPIVNSQSDNSHSPSEELQQEADMAELDFVAISASDHPGIPSGYACPECGGSLWELQHSNLIRFRCRVGHAYSAESLLADQSDALENALWVALRALEERAALSQQMASRAKERNYTISAVQFENQAQDAEQQAALIRQVLLARHPNTGNASLTQGGSPDVGFE